MERQFYRWLHTHENIIMNTWSTSANRSPPKILYSGPLRHMVKLHSVRGKMVCFIKAAWQCIRRHLVHIVYVYLDVYVGYDCHLKKKKKKKKKKTPACNRWSRLTHVAVLAVYTAPWLQEILLVDYLVGWCTNSTVCVFLCVFVCSNGTD